MPNPKNANAPDAATANATLSERALCGALLLDHDAVFQVCQQAGITGASFTDPRCAHTWDTMAALREAHKIVDLVTVSEALGGDAGDNLTELARFVELCPTTTHAAYYAKEIRTAERPRGLSNSLKLAQEQLENGVAIDTVADGVKAALEGVEDRSEGGPEIVSAHDFTAVNRVEPIQIVHGVLRAGQIGIMSASSKVGKTWALLAAAFAVTTGKRWFGWNTAQARVLYINAELPDYDLEQRLKKLADVLGLAGLPDGLDVWHLRGQSKTIPQLLPDILRRQRERGPYGLILPDPLYRFGQGRDEIDNAVQAITMNELNEVAEQTTAAILAVHHFSKGNQSGKDHIDRASGAGVFARAPDAILTLTAHEESDCYTLESTCRSFAKPDPVVARWNYPLWTLADELDPERLKTTMGRPAKFSTDDLLDLLPAAGLSHGEWLDAAKKKTGIGKTRFSELVRMARGKGLVVSAFGKYVRGGAE